MYLILVIVLIVVIAMMFMRYRRKSVYNKFDNQFQYNHEDDTVRYQGSPEGELYLSISLSRQQTFASWYGSLVIHRLATSLACSTSNKSANDKIDIFVATCFQQVQQVCNSFDCSV